MYVITFQVVYRYSYKSLPDALDLTSYMLLNSKGYIVKYCRCRLLIEKYKPSETQHFFAELKIY